MAYRKTYPFSLEWWEHPGSKRLMFIFIIISDFVMRFAAIQPGFNTKDIFDQGSLAAITFMIILVIDILPSMFGGFVGNVVSCNAKIRKIIACLAIGTMALVYIISCALSLQCGKASAIEKTEQSQTSVALTAEEDSPELLAVNTKVESTKAVLYAILPIASSVFLAVMSFATADSQRRISTYNKLESKRQQLTRVQQKRIALEHRPSMETLLDIDATKSQEALNRVEIYLRSWQRSVQMPLVEKMADPRMTTRMLADSSINQYDFPRNGEENDR